GYKEEELVGKSLKDLFEQKYHKKIDQYLDEIKLNGESSGLMYLKCKAGQNFIFEYRNSVTNKNGELVAVRGIARNVTEQKRAVTALSESETRFRRLVKFSPLPMAVHRGGRWVYVNDAGKKLIAANSAEEVIGKPLLYFIKPEWRKAVKERIRKISLAGNEASFFQEKLVRLDGKEIEVEVVAMPIYYGGKRGGQVVIRDITESKRLQEELARAQRLETAGRIAGQIAHDLNNLLAPLTAYPTLIREDLPANHPVLDLVDDMESAAIKIAEINQQLLALGRRGHYAMEIVDLKDLIQRVLNSQKLPETIVVNTDFSSDFLMMKGGAAQLTRAFTNLILNAKEAMQGMGVLTIKIEPVYLDEPVRGYETIKRGQYIKLNISDTGTGIDATILDKIFDPFYTTKRMDRMRGSGLGLSIVHGIMEDHDGYITVESILGQGTTFSLYFPITKAVDRESESVNEISTGHGEKILIVDDDPVQRSVAGQLLERLGYQVTMVASGEEAVKHVKVHPQDLLVLDMGLDGIDGAETYRQILEFQANQKAIIISGYAMSQRVEEALQLGVGTFVAKPVTPNSLADAIRKELDRKHSDHDHFHE
ncbi:MAG: PAS domain S-box protein, partial [bacterium]